MSVYLYIVEYIPAAGAGAGPTSGRVVKQPRPRSIWIQPAVTYVLLVLVLPLLG